VIKQATLNLVELLKYRQLICGYFESFEAALKVVPSLLEFAQAAIELIDKATLDGAKSKRQQQQNRFWIDGDPQAVLIIDLFDEKAESLKTRLQTDQAWLNQVSNEERKVLLHVHCHQKALATPMDHRKALELISGITVEMMPTGCCGMSGDFGYKHYDVSKKIAEQVLLPKLALVHLYSSAKAL
jgi:FAD/FMN-containing dehydrogenase